MYLNFTKVCLLAVRPLSALTAQRGWKDERMEGWISSTQSRVYPCTCLIEFFVPALLCSSTRGRLRAAQASG